MANDRPNLKQIRIKKSICERLDEMKGSDDSYSDVVKRLLDDNEALKNRCAELEHDKDNITTVSKALAVELALNNPELYKSLDIDKFEVKEQDQ